ncbi:TBC1 domain member 5, partial [Ichthyophthirius multifiliis]
DYNFNSKKQQAILLRISRIQDNYLKIIDLELFKHFKLLNVEFQIFLLRWIRCVYTREYSIQNAMFLWDNIFLE